jgi:UDP-N-acetylglucosamine--N-acetylmuramyl-(pentapeptide) pyrophosphoryl-undecaprenol N-acetylglucosamine transferase
MARLSGELMAEKNKKQLTIMIAGGGTGGHLFPGIALAESFEEKGAAIHFAGTNKGIEFRVIPELGYPLHLIPVRGIKGGKILSKLLGLFILPIAFFKCIGILRKVKPDVVVGVGGYASGPMVMTAALFGYVTAILEQNTVPGVTNRMLGKRVKKVFISFDESKKFFPEKKIIYSGNPVRKKICDNIEKNKVEKTGDNVNILVFGGSQGAHRINVLMSEGIGLLKDKNISILHQTGKMDKEFVEEKYKNSGVEGEVKEFINDMAKAYGWADIIICRAGATTIAELSIAKKPCILIPYPYASDNHQEHNARSLENQGKAFCLVERELSEEILMDKIIDLIDDEKLREKMINNMGSSLHKDAAHNISSGIIELLPEQRQSEVK